MIRRTSENRWQPKERTLAAPRLAAPVRGKTEFDLDSLKHRLLAGSLAQTEDPELHPTIRRAANDAATAAWLTPFPLLVLPVLLEEKVDAARRHNARQKAILRKSRPRADKNSATAESTGIISKSE